VPNNQTQRKHHAKQRILKRIIIAIAIAIGLIASYSAYSFVNAWITNCPNECTDQTRGQFYKNGTSLCFYFCEYED
jgi:hypothetical protein